LSLDDFYLTHTEQVTLAWEHSTNPLLQDRGQPSTHDLALGGEVFDSLAAERPTAIPRYNKSACEGWGDRAPKDQWKLVNQEGERTAKVIIIEGWCIGYRAWDDQTLRAKWEDAVHKSKFGVYVGKLAYVKFEHMKVINDALRNYDVLTE
jgi:D-glycerate 3-kinase